MQRGRLATHLADQGPNSSIGKVLPNHVNNAVGEKWNNSNKRIQMTLKWIKSASTSFIREVQIRTTDSNFHWSVWPKSNHLIIHSVGEAVETEECHTFFGMAQTGTTPEMTSWHCSSKSRQLLWPSSSRCTSDWLVHTPNDHVHKHAHGNTVYEREINSAHQYSPIKGPLDKWRPSRTDWLRCSHSEQEWGSSPSANKKSFPRWRDIPCEKEGNKNVCSYLLVFAKGNWTDL